MTCHLCETDKGNPLQCPNCSEQAYPSDEGDY